MIDIQNLLQNFSDSSLDLQRSFKDLQEYKNQQDTPDFDNRVLFFLYAKYLSKRKDFIEIKKQCSNLQMMNTTMC